MQFHAVDGNICIARDVNGSEDGLQHAAMDRGEESKKEWHAEGKNRGKEQKEGRASCRYATAEPSTPTWVWATQAEHPASGSVGLLRQVCEVR